MDVYLCKWSVGYRRFSLVGGWWRAAPSQKLPNFPGNLPSLLIVFYTPPTLIQRGNIERFLCNLSTSHDSLHHRLRPIDGGQFRFPSHFIRIQIFQINFPLILYLKGTKWTLLNQLSKEKGTSWPFLNDTYIWRKQLVHRYLQNNICYFRRPISP